MVIITKSIAQDIISKNKSFAPESAKVILVHDDGRVVFAEKFEIGSTFWWSDTMRESTLQGVIHKLTLVAKRNDLGEWVAVVDFSSKGAPPAPKSRHERILDEQSKLIAARKGKAAPVIKPATTPALKSTDLPPVSQKAVEQLAEKRQGVVKSDKVVEPFKPEPAAVAEVASAVAELAKTVREEIFPETASAEDFDLNEFVSIRSLDKNRARKGDLFLSLRSNGKLILNKDLRDAVSGWGELNIMVRRDYKAFAICRGTEYRNNSSGTYVNRTVTDKLEFPTDTGTIRVMMVWNEKLSAFVGSVQ